MDGWSLDREGGPRSLEQIELAAGTAKHEAVAERVRHADGMQTRALAASVRLLDLGGDVLTVAAARAVLARGM